MTTLHSNIRPPTLIEAVRARRIALKMSLHEFAKAVGRSIDAVSAWENGHSIPRRSTRKLLVEWLGFDPEGGLSDPTNTIRSASERP